MKIEMERWRALPAGERAARGLAYNAQIEKLLFERVGEVHPGWSHEQHKMMFFKLRYAGENFEVFTAAKIKRGDWTGDEVAAVQATPIPFDRAECERYTTISHPEMDEGANTWPSAAERGSNS